MIFIINKENNSKSMGYALDDDKFPSIKRVFMTATVKHYVLKDDSEVEVFSMNNKELYGQISYEYSLREAINDRNISDYQIVGIVIDSEYIEKFRAIDELEKKVKTMQEQIETMNLQCGENSLMNQTENNKQIDEESQEANDGEID